MKVLIIGKPVNFINQVITAIKEEKSDFEASVVRDENAKINNDTNKIYKQIIDFKTDIGSILFTIKAIPKLIHFLYLSLALFCVNQKQGLKSFKCVMDAYLYMARIQHAKPLENDIYNLHFISIKKAIISLFIPLNKNIVISTWGSDIFRTNGLCYNLWLRKAYERANTIQVSSVEMAQCIYEEFGFDLKKKVKFALYLPDFNLLDLIKDKKEKNLDIDNFKSRHLISPDTICITVGNNGNTGNQHIETLKSIESLKNHDKITVLLPLTYSLTKAHEKVLSNYIEDSKLNIVCFKKFLNWEDLALLRVVSDIFITMQITDAMSATLTEILYAGNIGIAGSWLPYSRFRESGAKFTSCANFKQLTSELEFIIQNMNYLKEENKSNPLAIATYFYNKKALVSQWIDIYQN